MAFYKLLHQKFALSFPLNEQNIMANAAITRLNIMNFVLEPDVVEFGFDLDSLPNAHDQTWQRFTVRLKCVPTSYVLKYKVLLLLTKNIFFSICL